MSQINPHLILPPYFSKNHLIFVPTPTSTFSFTHHKPTCTALPPRQPHSPAHVNFFFCHPSSPASCYPSHSVLPVIWGTKFHTKQHKMLPMYNLIFMFYSHTVTRKKKDSGQNGDRHSLNFVSSLFIQAWNFNFTALINIWTSPYFQRIYVFFIWYVIYLLTAIGLSPGGSSTVHIYTQTVHRTKQNKQYIEEHNNLWECGPCPVLARFALTFALQLRKKHGKTSVRVAASKNT